MMGEGRLTEANSREARRPDRRPWAGARKIEAIECDAEQRSEAGDGQSRALAFNGCRPRVSRRVKHLAPVASCQRAIRGSEEEY